MSEAISAMASVVASSRLADTKCPGMREDIDAEAGLFTRLSEFRRWDQDLYSKAVATHTDKAIIEFKKLGPNRWCAEAWQSLGPNSTVKTIRAK